MKVVCFDWECAHEFGDAWLSQHRLRYDLFIQRNSWDVPSFNGMEYDEFDTPAAKYVVILDGDNRARGVTRLLPTTRPYMIRSLWPELVDGDIVDGAEIWEATRFGVDRRMEASQRQRAVCALIAACQEFGLRHGVHAFLSVMPLIIYENVLARAGCAYEYLGPPARLGRHQVAAARLEVSARVLNAARRAGGLAGPVLFANDQFALSA